MTLPQQAMLDSVLALPESERVEFVHALLDSLAFVDESDDVALAQELERRLDECRQDPSAALPWSQVKQMR